MNFLEITQSDDRKLDLPAGSVLFVEGLDPDAKKENAGCKSGLFYDLGGEQPNGRGGFQQGKLQSALAKETFAKLAKAVRAASPTPRIEVKSSLGQPALIEVGRIVSLQDLPDDHPNGGKCVITHTVGARLLPLDVKQTRDEIRALAAKETEG